jgi:hypothetical protein
LAAEYFSTSGGGKAVGTKIDVPDIRELAALYKKALSSKNSAAGAVAEAAVLEIAHAEAALAEAAALHHFAREIS